jgi:hypothetical protein
MAASPAICSSNTAKLSSACHGTMPVSSTPLRRLGTDARFARVGGEASVDCRGFRGNVADSDTFGAVLGAVGGFAGERPKTIGVLVTDALASVRVGERLGDRFTVACRRQSQRSHVATGNQRQGNVTVNALLPPLVTCNNTGASILYALRTRKAHGRSRITHRTTDPVGSTPYWRW